MFCGDGVSRATPDCRGHHLRASARAHRSSMHACMHARARARGRLCKKAGTLRLKNPLGSPVVPFTLLSLIKQPKVTKEKGTLIIRWLLGDEELKGLNTRVYLGAI